MVDEMIRGRAHKFSHNIDTDVIIAARYLTTTDPLALAPHCMEALAPDFARTVRNGDVLVAGDNFGCGSSREHAVIALKATGIRAVVARSFARIFFRNSINQAFPLIVSPEAADATIDGDAIAIDLTTGVVDVSGRTFTTAAQPEFLRNILKAGGLVPFVRAQLSEPN